MGLLSVGAEVKLSNNVKYYESLGYEIPKYYDKKHKKYSVPRGSKIFVRISDLPLGSHAIVDVECDGCGELHQMEYKTYLKFLHEDGNIYCIKCACSLFNGGNRNHAWNPNLTDEERILKRGYPEYSEFVKKALERDNYICQRCGMHSGKLEVHHLDGYSWCKEKRLDLTNAITLCENCHGNFHFVYGRRDNTKEQFEEWVGHTVRLIDFKDIPMPKARRVYCVEDNKEYESVRKLFEECGVDISSVYLCCNQKIGGTVHGKHYIWADEVDGLNHQDILNLIKKQKIEHMLDIEHQHNNNGKRKHISRPIICLNDNGVFSSATKAANYYGIPHTGIIRCCNNEQKTSGVSSDGTRLTWMFYSDYLKQIGEKQYERKFI